MLGQGVERRRVPWIAFLQPNEHSDGQGRLRIPDPREAVVLDVPQPEFLPVFVLRRLLPDSGPFCNGNSGGIIRDY